MRSALPSRARRLVGYCRLRLAPLEAVMDWAGERFKKTRKKAAQMLERAKLAGHTRFA